MLEDFTIHTFSEHIGDVFRVHADEPNPVEITLESATEIGGDPDSGWRKPFSLVFRGSTDTPLPQRTYEVEHDGIGDFALFLVPISPDEAGMRYEAIFT